MLYDNNYNSGLWPFAPQGDRVVETGLNSRANVLITNPVLVAYTSQGLIVGRLGGLVNMLIPATDDAGTGEVNADVLTDVITNVTNEINGALGTVYPIPFVKRDTVALVRVKTVSSTGAVTEVEMVTDHLGSYYTAPDTANSPVYAYPRSNLWQAGNDCLWPWPSYSPCWTQAGTGLALTVAYTTGTAPFSVTGTPSIATAGTGYVVGDTLALVGGASFVPSKVQTIALDLVCEELYMRRLNVDEKNVFATTAKRHREELAKIGSGDGELDALYPRLYSPGSAWVTYSRLNTGTL